MLFRSCPSLPTRPSLPTFSSLPPSLPSTPVPSPPHLSLSSIPVSLLHTFGAGSPLLRSRPSSPSVLALSCLSAPLLSSPPPTLLAVNYLLMTPVSSCYPLPWRLLGPTDSCCFAALPCSKRQAHLLPLLHGPPPLPSQGSSYVLWRSVYKPECSSQRGRGFHLKYLDSILVLGTGSLYWLTGWKDAVFFGGCTHIILISCHVVYNTCTLNA